jgi:hypothetical protein
MILNLKRYYCLIRKQQQIHSPSVCQCVRANQLKGKASPEFTFENHKGGTTKLSDLKGQ